MRWVGALLIALLYGLLAARMGERYPFSSFEMFAERSDTASRILVRVGEGDELAEVHDFQDFLCEGDPWPRPTSAEADRFRELIPLERSALLYVDNHSASRQSTPQGDERDLLIVRQLWSFEAGPGSGSTEPDEEQVLARCRARPATLRRDFLRSMWNFQQ